MENLIKLTSAAIITVGMFVAQSSSGQGVVSSADFKPVPSADQSMFAINWIGCQSSTATSVFAVIA
ncbi:hypothetical protein ACWPKO_15835 [Coraliomargarita sp. W4R53]